VEYFVITYLYYFVLCFAAFKGANFVNIFGAKEQIIPCVFNGKQKFLNGLYDPVTIKQHKLSSAAFADLFATFCHFHES
jgi:hypothetical protein